MSSETVTTDREIVLTRLLNAPRELVWKAWTEPEHLIKWWGPDGFTNTFHEIDVRAGGEWRFVMHGPDGTDYDNFVRFLEVVQPERIVYDQGTGPDNLMFRGRRPSRSRARVRESRFERCSRAARRVTGSLSATAPSRAASRHSGAWPSTSSLCCTGPERRVSSHVGGQQR